MTRLSLAVCSPDFGALESASTQRYRALAEAADALNHRVEIVNSAGRTPPGEIQRPTRRIQKAFKRHLLVRGALELVQGVQIGLRCPRADRVLVASPPYFSALAAVATLGVRGLQHDLDVRDIYPETLAAAGVITSGGLSYRVLSLLTDALFRRARTIVVATDDIGNRISPRLGGGRTTITVINGYSSAFSMAPSNPPPEPLIACHGTMGRLQDVGAIRRLIIECSHCRPHWRFLVVGDGPKAGEIASLNTSNLEYIRALEHRELARRLMHASIGLSVRTDDPISTGAIPVRTLEYVGAGIPSLIAPPSEGSELLASLGVARESQTTEVPELVSHLDSMLDPATYSAMRNRVAQVRPGLSGTAQWSSYLSHITEFDKAGNLSGSAPNLQNRHPQSAHDESHNRPQQ